MPSEILALAVVLSYGVGAWMVTLSHFGVTAGLGDKSLVIQWLSVSTVALPLVLAGVAVALRATRALSTRLSPAGGSAQASVAALMRVLFAAVGGAVTFAAAVPVYEWITAADTEGSLPLAAAIAQNTMLALVVALPLAAVAERLGAFYARRATSEPEIVAGEPRRRGRITVLATVVSTGLLTIGVGSVPDVANAADPGSPCPVDAPVKHFDISAIDIKTPLNRNGDNNPAGKLYILNSKIAAARAQEASQQVSTGLRDDPIQSLAIRANEGDCVEINFTNSANGGNYGVHIDGLAFEMGSSGDKIGNNADSSVPKGSSATYRYYVPNDPAMEGAHYMHPGPGFRDAIGNGLFGELVVEPPGSTYLDANDATPLESGWEAMIVPGNGQAPFREYVLMFHTIGNDNQVIYDKNGQALPQVDDLTDTYRPGAFAINDRSDPFRHRVEVNPKEEADGYSSYPFGDPSTPMPRGYLADPTKIRLTNPGGDKFHAFHLHGGGIRWRQDPVADPTWNYADTGLQKDPVTQETPSMRNDAQAIGPGESYNLEIEGGNGGVQQAVGDFLFHCHIVKHYVAGMWTFWRVYNTLQPNLAVLPGRTAPPEAVTSAALIGKTFNGTTITANNIAQWVTPQLPPQGVRQNDQDSAVFNWTIDNSDPTHPLVLNEPEDLTEIADSAKVIPGHPNLQLGDTLVGDRPVMMFDPTNGRPAYPMLRTHVGQRPPFSPNGHSGAPYLGETANAAATGAVDPFAGRQDGICPDNRTIRHYNIVAITKPIAKNAIDVDNEGEIYVLANHKDAIYAGQYSDDPLAIRANAGDCIAVTLTSELSDATAFGGFSKVNIHIHHVQFDVQGSDGVITGFNYETAVRPYKAEDPQITASAAAGATSLALSSTSKFQVGEYIAAGMGTNDIEINQITAINGLSVSLAKPLTKAHPAGQWAGTEFVQYRWYPDTVLDNIFFHDHVDAIHSWIHGLVGMLIIEPPGSTYHDPKTGAEVDSGTLVDIHTTSPLSAGLVDGSYRELALWTIDDNNVDQLPSTFNLRNAPLSDRSDTNERFSSWKYGDPSTPLPRLYQGDTLVIRTINVGPNEDSIHFDGATYLPEFRMTDANGNHNAQESSTLSYNDSERFTLVLGGDASGPSNKPGDHLYFNGDDRHLQDGVWGIIRVLDGNSPDLQPLPSNPNIGGTAQSHGGSTGSNPPPTPSPGNPCPVGAPAHTFNVSAVDLPSGNTMRMAYVPSSIAKSVARGSIHPEPLVMHVSAGECVTVNLTNLRNNAPVGFMVDKLLKDPGSIGVNVGYNTEQNTLPGQTRQYVLYAASDRVGTATIADMNSNDGADGTAIPLGDSPGQISPSSSGSELFATKFGGYGSIVVSEAGATFTNPVTGAATDIGSQVDVHVAGTPGYRDLTVMMFDDDPQIDQDHMPYPTFAEQTRSFVNYQAGTNWQTRSDNSNSFSGAQPTPLLRAYAGDPVMVHEVIAPGSEQGHVFTLGGMSAPRDRFIPGAERTDNQGLAPWASFDAKVMGGAGGTNHAVGDFYYGDLARPFVQVGLWGIFRVMSDSSCPIQPLDGRTCLGN